MAIAELLAEIRACRACARDLPAESRPILHVGEGTRLLICGQAPGRRANASGLSFDDPSGDRLRAWMGIGRGTFYSHPAIGVAGMAFCYPGTAPAGGDHPPPSRCAALWRSRLTCALPKVELTLLLGRPAHLWGLQSRAPVSMDATVKAWRSFLPEFVVLPHPSWRNTAWLNRNPWFADEVTPFLRRRVEGILAS